MSSSSAFLTPPLHLFYKKGKTIYWKEQGLFLIPSLHCLGQVISPGGLMFPWIPSLDSIVYSPDPLSIY